MELAAASEMSPGYRVDKQPTWHPHLARTLPCGSGLPSGGSGPAVYDAQLQGPPRAMAALFRQGVPRNAEPTRQDWDRWRDQSGVRQ